MTNLDSKNLLVRIFKGSFSFSFKGREIYFKHPSILDRAAVDSFYEAALKRNLEIGLSSREDLLKDAYENSIWTPEKENELANKRKVYKRTADTRATAKSIEASLGVNKALERMEKEMLPLLCEKEDIFRNSAEEIANDETIEEQVFLFSFSDENCTKPLFSEGERDYFRVEDPMDFNLLRNGYIECVNNVTNKVLRALAVKYFFQELFSLYKDSPYLFFNKPSFELTEYQISLLSWGSYFNNVLEMCGEAPADMREDPDYLESWAIVGKNQKNS